MSISAGEGGKLRALQFERGTGKTGGTGRTYVFRELAWVRYVDFGLAKRNRQKPISG